MPLVRSDENGLWCEAGGFHIDPWRPVSKALITHGHPEHARGGSGSYLCTAACAAILRERLGAEAPIDSLQYGEVRRIGEVSVSFHPAGHLPGSAQIRLEHRGEVWVVSGDYKLAPDSTCEPFEPVRCHTFLTEATFGLPIFRWAVERDVVASIQEWWRANQERKRCSVLFARPLGEAQRVLAALDAEIGPIFCHERIEKWNRVYRASGVNLPNCANTAAAGRGLAIAPPDAHGSPWVKQLGGVSTAMVSGWMRIRGTRRHRAIDRGFVISDHADWPELQQAIDGSGAERVLVTHGYRAPLVRWLEERGVQAAAMDTRFEDSESEAE